MKKVLLSAPYMLIEGDRFDKFFNDHNITVTRPDIVEHMSEAQLLSVIDQFDGAICGDDPYNRSVLSKAKKLKVISKWGTGINTIDLAAAKEYNIKVCNTPNAFSHPVADTALAFMLNFARDVMTNTTQMKQGIWSKTRCFSLSEKTLGIIGLGNIGIQVAKRAHAFNMKILANDIRQITPILLEQYEIEMVEKDEIYKKADIITIHCDLNDSTQHLLNYDTFNAMEKKPYIINTARGGHVRHEALLYALDNKIISGAGLDVFEIEPIPKGDRLLKCDNVLLAPHNSNSSKRYWERVHENTLKNLIENI